MRIVTVLCLYISVIFFLLYLFLLFSFFFFFSSRRRHTRSLRDWSSDVCSSDLVLDVRGEREARLLEHADPLAEVERLPLVHHVERAVEGVVLVAPEGGGDVARRVQRRPVLLAEEARRHAVGLEVDDLGALALDDEPLRLQHLDRG